VLNNVIIFSNIYFQSLIGNVCHNYLYNLLYGMRMEYGTVMQCVLTLISI
jgi:hypothetical protein